MKKIKLFLVLVLTLLMVPFGVHADEDKKPVNVYFFKGDGCGYCAAGLEWFDELDDKYDDMYKLHQYETWYDENNANLMNAVAEVRGETVNGVPYIVVGNQSWNGFDENVGKEILAKIKEEYKAEERYDVMDYVDEEALLNGNSKKEDDSIADDIAVTVLLLVVVAGVGLGIYALRKSN